MVNFNPMDFDYTSNRKESILPVCDKPYDMNKEMLLK